MLELPFALPRHRSEGDVGTVTAGKACVDVCGCFSLHELRRAKLRQYLTDDSVKGIRPPLLNVVSQ